MKRILFLILIFTGAIFAQSRFYYGDLEVAGDLDVDGASNLTGNITTLGTLSRPTSNYGLGLSVAGYITVGYIGISTPNQYPYMGIDSTLNTISFESDIFAVVSNTVTFSGDTVVIEGGLSIGSNATVASGLDVTGDLDVDGSARLGDATDYIQTITGFGNQLKLITGDGFITMTTEDSLGITIGNPEDNIYIGDVSQGGSIIAVDDADVEITLVANDGGNDKIVLNSDSVGIRGDLDVDGSVEIGEVLQLNLHTVAVGDSVLGRIFIDAADTTLKAGTGSDLVVIKDLAP